MRKTIVDTFFPEHREIETVSMTGRNSYGVTLSNGLSLPVTSYIAAQKLAAALGLSREEMTGRVIDLIDDHIARGTEFKVRCLIVEDGQQIFWRAVPYSPED